MVAKAYRLFSLNPVQTKIAAIVKPENTMDAVLCGFQQFCRPSQCLQVVPVLVVRCLHRDWPKRAWGCASTTQSLDTMSPSVGPCTLSRETKRLGSYQNCHPWQAGTPFLQNISEAFTSWRWCPYSMYSQTAVAAVGRWNLIRIGWGLCGSGLPSPASSSSNIGPASSPLDYRLDEAPVKAGSNPGKCLCRVWNNIT